MVPSTASGTLAGSASGSAPRPMPVAIMRNSHEVIRGAMSDIQSFLDQDEFENARELWRRFHRFSDLHMKMEEGRKGSKPVKGLFKIVDEHADGVAEEAGLFDCHRNLYELEEDVRDVFEQAPDMERAKDLYPIFRKENEEHLTEEENILMPAIEKMKKQGVPVGKYLKTDVLPILFKKEGDMEFFIRFGNEILEKHDNVPGHPRVRVFDHALWALASSPEQWNEWNVWIQDSLSPKKYLEVTEAIEAYQEEQKAKKNIEQHPPPVSNIDTSKPQGLFSRFFPKPAVS